MTAALPRISVIVPCYNAERYIGATLHSIYVQQRPERGAGDLLRTGACGKLEDTTSRAAAIAKPTRLAGRET